MKTQGLLINDFKFFKDYHDDLRKVLSEDDKIAFMNCPNDETKFKFVRDKMSKANLNWSFILQSSKDNVTAQDFKEKGNKCFQQEKYEESLEMYNKSLVFIEFSEGKSNIHFIFLLFTVSLLYHGLARLGFDSRRAAGYQKVLWHGQPKDT